VSKDGALVPIEDSVAKWVKDVAGNYEVDSQFAHQHGNASLWRIHTGAGFLWLKVHSSPGRWAAEVNALAEWGKRVSLVPNAIAYKSESNAVLISEIEGVPAKSFGREGNIAEQLWREAGEWLGQWHAIEGTWFGTTTELGTPQSKPERDPQRFAQADWSEILAKAKDSGVFNDWELGFASACAQEGIENLAEERPRATHRDFMPRNWLASASGHLAGVIDFEHARYDARAADICLLYHRDFILYPRLEQAFLDGYGGLDEALRSQLRAFRAMLSVRRATWAASVGAVEFCKENVEALHQIAGK